MSDALTYLRYIFVKYVNFIFNDMVISDGVTVGWVAVSVIMFGLMIRSILNVPRSVNFRSIRRRKDNE